MTIHHRIKGAEVLLTTWIVKPGSDPLRADLHPRAKGSRVRRYGVRMGSGPWELFTSHSEALKASQPKSKA